MTLTEKIEGDIKTAMKAREELTVSALRMLKAACAESSLQKGKSSLEDGEVLEVIQKLLKQRNESVEAFTKGGRMDLAQKEAKEAQILKAYLPPAMDEKELRSLIEAAIRELGASGPSAMGQVMKAVSPKVKGRADGKQVSTLVAQILQKGS